MSHERVRGGCVGVRSWLALSGSYRTRLAYSPLLSLIALSVGAPRRTEARTADRPPAGVASEARWQLTNQRNMARTRALVAEFLKAGPSTLRALPRPIRRAIVRHARQMIAVAGANESVVNPGRAANANPGELGPLESIFTSSAPAGETLGMAWVLRPSDGGRDLELQRTVDGATQRPRSGLLSTETTDRIALGVSGPGNGGRAPAGAPAPPTLERRSECLWRVGPGFVTTVAGAGDAFGAMAVSQAPRSMAVAPDGRVVEDPLPLGADVAAAQVEQFIREQLAPSRSPDAERAAAELRGFLGRHAERLDVLRIARPTSEAFGGIVLRVGSRSDTNGRPQSADSVLLVAANHDQERAARVPLGPMGDKWDVKTAQYPAASVDYVLAPGGGIVALAGPARQGPYAN